MKRRKKREYLKLRERRRQMQANAQSLDLKKKMLAVILGALLPMLLAITVLFLQTRSRMTRQYLQLATERTEKMSQAIDEMLWNIYAVSDKFAYDKELSPYLNSIYEEEAEDYKHMDMRTILNRIFEGYDLLRDNEKISAIYTYKGELFNFLDMGNDGPSVIQKLENMNIDAKENLMMFRWYSLRDNFLKSQKEGELRKDKVIFGSRRIYNMRKERYTTIHIFAIPEENLYEKYAGVIETLGAASYIIDENGGLLSSSDEEAVKRGYIPYALKRAVLNREKDQFELETDEGEYQICVSKSQVNDWLSVSMAPVKSITHDVDVLYRNIFIVIAICMLFCCYMILRFYRQFMLPVADLNQAMQNVNNGDLNAYVKVSKQYEMGRMMENYNEMLRSINTHVVERLNNEKQKKELEMEVLTSQINPHFLYNTLENIVWKSTEAGRPDIGRLAASLGRMYRLSASSDQIIRLQQEIEHLMAYVKIQKNRYGDDFDFELRTNAEEVREWYTPKLLLQPVVENSFLYAMEGINHPLHIYMDMRVRRDWLEIRVWDDGAGMDRERLEKVRRQLLLGAKASGEEVNRRSTGIGLHNVEARLELYFNVKNSLKIYSREGRGTLTVIRIPKITKEFAKKWSNGQK